MRNNPLFIAALLAGSAFAQTWVVQKPASPSTSASYTTSIRFFGIAQGRALDARGNLLKTANGGASWEYLIHPTLNPTSSALNSLSFISPDTGWITEGQDIYRTTNGGTTWQLRSQATTGRPVVTFLTADSGWMVGKNVSFYRTVDSGSTYTGKGTFPDYTRNLFFVDARTGWVITDARVYRNTGGENTWTESFRSPHVRSLFFANRSVGWLAGDSGMMYKTLDGGAVWATQAAGTRATLRAIHFLNADTGWMVGDSGMVLKTVNGGFWWSQIPTGTPENLTAVYFANSRTGWALGENGTVFKTVGADEPVGLLSTSPRGPSSLAMTGTWLNYHLGQPSRVRIALHGLQGRREAILFDGRQAAGPQALNLAASRLPSGIYLLDFRDDLGRTTKTLFLP